MLPLLLMLALGATPKIAAPKFETPKLDPPKLELKTPDLPKADGLAGPTDEHTRETGKGTVYTEARPAAARSGEGVKVESVVHARSFKVTATGRKPVGRLEALTIDALPGRVAAFSSCVRLVSGDGQPATIAIRIRTPSGEELLASRAEVNFGDNDRTELEIEWDGFEVAQAGDYQVTIAANGAPATTFPLPIRRR